MIGNKRLYYRVSFDYVEHLVSTKHQIPTHTLLFSLAELIV